MKVLLLYTHTLIIRLGKYKKKINIFFWTYPVGTLNKFCDIFGDITLRLQDRLNARR